MALLNGFTDIPFGLFNGFPIAMTTMKRTTSRRRLTHYPTPQMGFDWMLLESPEIAHFDIANRSL